MGRTICAVFDIDDTLYLERDYVRSGFEAVGAWASRWLGRGDFGERCWCRFVAGDRNSIFDKTLRECGKEPAPELIAALVAIYRTHVPSITLAPDAFEALSAISGNTPIAVISDGPITSQSRKAEALGLNAFADPILLTEVMGSALCKPHPWAFEQVQQSRPADKYVYIADNPCKDFTAPTQLGWVTVRIRRPGGLHFAVESSTDRPDYGMSDCSALPELLAGLQ